MRPEERALVAHLCAAKAGLTVDAAMDYPIESRLAPLARREGFASVSELLQAIRGRREERLIWALVEAMAPGETAFFRDRDAFAELAEVLPVIARRRDGKPLRIWSAACSSGQEIYSVAMMVEDPARSEAGLSVELFASDLSERRLEKARSGLYTQFEVQRGLPIRKLVDHFEQRDDMWTISPRLRQAVRWRRINLIADLSPVGQFDVILCRYVLSGMSGQHREQVLRSLARALPEDGVLVLGLNEAGADTGGVLEPAGPGGLFRRHPAFQVAA